jgi:pimeloyl-ACP methyl ester carboxylesterase
MLEPLARALDRCAQHAERLLRFHLLRPSVAQTTAVRDLGFYARRLDDFPDTLFGTLQKPADVGVARLGVGEGVELLQVSFPSPCQPIHPEFLGAFESMPENHVCYARWVRPAGRPSEHRSTCVVLHDWGERSLARALQHCSVSAMVQRGLTAVVPLLPHHGERRPAGARFSGEPFLCSDLVCTVESHLQAVRETRALLGWLRAGGCEQLGLVGWGIGGLVAAIVCGLERDLDYAVLLLSPSQLTGLLRPEPAPALRDVHDAIRRQGLLEVLEEAWRPLDTQRLGLALPSSRVRIIGATGDGLVPRSEVERLARITASPVEWVGSGHGRPGGALRSRSVLVSLLDALRSLGALETG